MDSPFEAFLQRVQARLDPVDLAKVPAAEEGVTHAAVTLLLRPAGGAAEGDASADSAEILFIKRAERAGDPWSGHLAFPGGRGGETGRHPAGRRHARSSGRGRNRRPTRRQIARQAPNGPSPEHPHSFDHRDTVRRPGTAGCDAPRSAGGGRGSFLDAPGGAQEDRTLRHGALGKPRTVRGNCLPSRLPKARSGASPNASSRNSSRWQNDIPAEGQGSVACFSAPLSLRKAAAGRRGCLPCR